MITFLKAESFSWKDYSLLYRIFRFIGLTDHEFREVIIKLFHYVLYICTFSNKYWGKIWVSLPEMEVGSADYTMLHHKLHNIYHDVSSKAQDISAHRSYKVK